MLRFLIILFIAPSAALCQDMKFQIDSIDGRTVFMAWDDQFPVSVRPALLALHGSGRSAESYIPGHEKSVPFYEKQRDLAVKAGYLFVVLSNGKDTWGTDEGLKATVKCMEFVKGKFPVREKWCIWASSAGGVLLGRLLKEYPSLVDRAIGTFPVYDLEHSMRHLPSARSAWGDRDYRKANPALYPEAFMRIPYLIFHGSDDEAVPVDLHSARIAKTANEAGGNVLLNIVTGGHSTGNFALYDDDLILNFLQR